MDTWLKIIACGKTERIGGTSYREKLDNMALVEPEESVRTISWVGVSKSRSEQKRRKKERRETRRGGLKDERGERLENKSWRASRDLADTASGKSHRSVTEEQEGKKKQSTLPPLRSLRLRFFFPRILFFFAETNRTDPVPVLRFTRFSK